MCLLPWAAVRFNGCGRVFAVDHGAILGALRAKGAGVVTPALLHDVFKELGIEKAIVPESKEGDGEAKEEAKEEGEEGGAAAEGGSDAPPAEPQFTNHAAALLAALGTCRSGRPRCAGGCLRR